MPPAAIDDGAERPGAQTQTERVDVHQARVQQLPPEHVAGALEPPIRTAAIDHTVDVL